MYIQNKDFIFQKAINAQSSEIFEIISAAKERRAGDGSSQWQDGYPNLETITNDLEKGAGYCFIIDSKIAAYCAIIFDIEPAYEIIEGSWESSEKYVTVHRVAVSEEFLGKGIATKLFKEIEEIAKLEDYFVIKVDTIVDNLAMLKILEKLNYNYRGIVYFRGSSRKAFEKILRK